MMSTLHRTPEGVVQYTKGAPDEILAHCTAVWENGGARPITQEDRDRILAKNKEFASDALACSPPHSAAMTNCPRIFRRRRSKKTLSSLA